MNRPGADRALQRGMVLVTSLVILVVLTLLGLAAMQNTTLEERMAGNLRAQNVAFQASEAALRAGEGWIGAEALLEKPEPNVMQADGVTVWEADETGLDPSGSTARVWWAEADADWWQGTGIAYYDAAEDPGALVVADGVALTGNSRPRYIIEENGIVFDSLVTGQQQDHGAARWFHQVTSRGVDISGRGEVLLRSTFARRF